MSTIIHGVGKDEPTVTNANGAKQSKLPYRADLYPPRSFLRVSGVLEYGARKYAPNNWLGIPVEDHLNHALVHIMAHLAGDTSDDHLGHATCRMTMALERHLLDQEEAAKKKDSAPKPRMFRSQKYPDHVWKFPNGADPGIYQAGHARPHTAALTIAYLENAPDVEEVPYAP